MAKNVEMIWPEIVGVGRQIRNEKGLIERIYSVENDVVIDYASTFSRHHDQFGIIRTYGIEDCETKVIGMRKLHFPDDFSGKVNLNDIEGLEKEMYDFQIN